MIALADEAVLTAVRTGWAPPVEVESPAAAVIRPVLVPTDDWRSCTVAGKAHPVLVSVSSDQYETTVLPAAAAVPGVACALVAVAPGDR